MVEEKIAANDKDADALENLLFATSVGGHTPGLYYKIYSNRFNQPEEDEGIDWVTPSSREDLADLFAALQQNQIE